MYGMTESTMSDEHRQQTRVDSTHWWSVSQTLHTTHTHTHSPPLQLHAAEQCSHDKVSSELQILSFECQLGAAGWHC